MGLLRLLFYITVSNVRCPASTDIALLTFPVPTSPDYSSNRTHKRPKEDIDPLFPSLFAYELSSLISQFRIPAR